MPRPQSGQYNSVLPSSCPCLAAPGSRPFRHNVPGRPTVPEFTLKLRRSDPAKGIAAHWDNRTVEMRGSASVLDAILKIRGEEDGSIGIRCSCQQGICGSCGVRMNGKPGLACNTHLEEAAARGGGASTGRESHTIEVEPLGNMPVIRDLIVDMDAVHWKKIRRVTPWLLAREPVPQREYI